MPVARLTKVQAWYKRRHWTRNNFHLLDDHIIDGVKHDAPCGFLVFINFTRISSACLAVENGLQLINNKPQASSSEQLLVNIIRDFTHDQQSHRIFLILHEFHQPELWCIYIYMVVMFAGSPYLTSIWWHHLTSPTIIHQESHASLQQFPHFVKTRMKLIALS